MSSPRRRRTSIALSASDQTWFRSVERERRSAIRAVWLGTLRHHGRWPRSRPGSTRSARPTRSRRSARSPLRRTRSRSRPGSTRSGSWRSGRPGRRRWMPAATRPLATDADLVEELSGRDVAPSRRRGRREKTTASGASAALRTTSSVRLPVAGISTFSGEEYSRTLPPTLAPGVGHGVRGRLPPGGPRRSDRLAAPVKPRRRPRRTGLRRRARGGHDGRPDHVVDRRSTPRRARSWT